MPLGDLEAGVDGVLVLLLPRESRGDADGRGLTGDGDDRGGEMRGGVARARCLSLS